MKVPRTKVSRDRGSGRAVVPVKRGGEGEA